MSLCQCSVVFVHSSVKRNPTQCSALFKKRFFEGGRNRHINVKPQYALRSYGVHTLTTVCISSYSSKQYNRNQGGKERKKKKKEARMIRSI